MTAKPTAKKHKLVPVGTGEYTYRDYDFSKDDKDGGFWILAPEGLELNDSHVATLELAMAYVDGVKS